MPNDGNATPPASQLGPTIIRTGPTLAEAFPPDWIWCGGCGSPNRQLTEDEALALLTAIAGAGAAVCRGDRPSALAVLDEIGWPIEMHARSRAATCSCSPCPACGHQQ